MVFNNFLADLYKLRELFIFLRLVNRSAKLIFIIVTPNNY